MSKDVFLDPLSESELRTLQSLLVRFGVMLETTFLLDSSCKIWSAMRIVQEHREKVVLEPKSLPGGETRL